MAERGDGSGGTHYLIDGGLIATARRLAEFCCRWIASALVRRVLGTPQPDQLKAAPVPQVLDYLRSMVDPVKAGTQRYDFTLSVEGDPATYRLQLRNGVLIPSRADAPSATHLMHTRAQLADLVRGTGIFPGTGGGLAGFDTLFDHSQFLSREAVAAKLAASPNQPQGNIRPTNRGRGNVWFRDPIIDRCTTGLKREADIPSRRWRRVTST